MRGNRLVRLLLLLVNGLLIGTLGISLLAPFIPPHVTSFPAFFGLAFVPLLLANIGFIVFWLLVKTNYALFSATIVALSIPNILNHFSINNPNEMGDISVMSYNVRLFDLYNWTGSHKTRPMFVEFFENNPADIYCFQEYFRSDSLPYFNTAEVISEAIGKTEKHEYFSAVLHDGLHRFGIATYSRYPILKNGLVPLDTSGNNVAIYTDILVKQETLRVFNMHLASVHLSAMEKEINDHIEQQDQLKQWRDLKLLIRKLAGGYKKRSQQADHIADYISESPHPVIVCGDFNDTPGSYSYRAIKGDLNDAFVEHGSGFGTSYVGYFPSLRIDYSLLDPRLAAKSFETMDIRLSDHRPILTTFDLAED